MMRRRRSRRWPAVAGVAGAVVLAVFVYLWLDMRKANEPIIPPDETIQTPVVEPSAPEKLKTPPADDNRQAEATQVEPPRTPQRETQEASKGTNGNLDPVAEAWARLDYIKANLHEWGTFSTRAEELIDQLTPILNVMPEGVVETDAGVIDSIPLLEELDDYGDPRSAKVFTEYLFNVMLGRPQIEALIALGPPSVPFILPYLEEDVGRVYIAAHILARIGEAHRAKLGGSVEHIIVPKMERLLAVDDPSKTVYYDKKELREALNRLKKVEP